MEIETGSGGTQAHATAGRLRELFVHKCPKI